MSKSAHFTQIQPEKATAHILHMHRTEPERLVGIGFRCWLAGFKTGDISSWETAFNEYSHVLGREKAKTVLMDLAQFVRAVQATAQRDIEVEPAGCPAFCRDECLAISIVAACQHGTRPALCASAAALVGSGDIGDTLAGAQNLASALRDANQVLSKSSICPATCGLALSRRRILQ